jgi:diguanylate cyclase (GGDEF)-like protein
MTTTDDVSTARQKQHSPLRILLADDDPSCRHEIGIGLGGLGYVVDQAEDGYAAWDLLQTNPPHVAVLGWMTAGHSGPELCRMAKAHSSARNTYFILLSGRTSTEEIIAGLRAGANDYIRKPVCLPELEARVQVGCRIIVMQQQLMERAQELETTLRDVQGCHAEAEVAARRREHYLAFHDSLTCLPNRQLFFDLLSEATKHPHGREEYVGVFFIDLDGFKLVNDAIGHTGGDQVLRMAARRLKSALREGDIVARLGGDEFAILARDLTKASDVASVAERLLRCFSEVFLVESQKHRLGASIGVSLFPTDGQNAESLVQQADTAMYRAKRQGKNQFLRYDRAIDSFCQVRLTVENDWRDEVDQGQMVLHFQPEPNVDTEVITGT